jgi:glycerophosphoryl diester phosphodiesterase
VERWIPALAAAAAAAIAGGPLAGCGHREPPRCEAAAVPIVIAHRGASGHRPEHTLAAYQLAIEQGADFVEPDLVSTRDGVLVARHENELSTSTDVAVRPEYATRRTTRTIDGVAVTGWFSEDFTLAELETLRAVERMPRLRGTAFDGQFAVPTFQQVIDLVSRANERLGRTGAQRIGLYVETKHPSYFEAIGLPLEQPLVKALEANGLSGPDAPVYVQSFEVESLRRLHRLTDVALVQLIHETGRPYDLAASGDPRTYADLLRPEGLDEIARYARGIGVNKNLVAADAELIRRAHRRGLRVHAWTLRAENAFLAPEHRVGSRPHDLGDLAGEATRLLHAGVDGFFTDHVAIAVAARDRFVRRHACSHPQ